jgi:myo-inositol 2-dehydrogenase/D-chiro-inositol 1-dehydrogenase
VTASRLSARPDWAAWLTDEAQSGGVVVDLMSHDLDQLNWLLGTPRRVTALARARDHVQALVEYDDAAGVVEGSWAMPRSYPFSAAIRVLGDEGAAEYSFSSAPVEGGNVGAPAASSGLRLFPRDGAATSVPVEAGDPWALQLASFVDCVERGVAPEQGTGAQALLALETALAVRRSLDLGASVALR